MRDYYININILSLLICIILNSFIILWASKDKLLKNKGKIIKSAKKTNRVVTVENHSIIGGLGSAVCEVLSENYPVSVKRIGTNDEFGQSGNAKELMEFYGLSADKLAQRIIGFFK